MPSFKKKGQHYVIRFTKRGIGERKYQIPATTPIAKVRRIESQMNLAYNTDWDPFRQKWDSYTNKTSAMEFGESVLMFFQEKKELWSAATLESYRVFFNMLRRHISEETPLSWLTPTKFLDIIKPMGKSEATLTSRKRMLNNYFSYLRKNDLADFCAFPIKQPNNIRLKYIVESEVLAICEYYEQETVQLQQKHHRNVRPINQSDLWKVMFYQGLRAGEVIKIRVEDISENREWMLVRGKGKSNRTIPIRDIVLPVLEKYLDKPKKSRLFGVIAYDKTFLNFKRCLRSCLSEDRHHLNLHSLRHGCGTYMAEQGVPITFIRDFLGHKSVKTTEIYAKIRPGSLQEKIKTI